jgi:tetratricopeptide (TPR) repeat protein
MRSARVLLGTAMLGLATSAHAEWRRFETAHFIIYSESGDKRVNELAAGLEKIDGLMRMATGLSADVEPVKVRIYEMADEGPVQQALGEVNTGVAGFYSSNIFGPYAVTLRKAYSAKGDFTAELVLHHEYAHHFMLQYFPANYPGWYSEGFAEMIGSSRILPDGRVAYGFPAKHRGDAIAYDWMPLEELLTRPPEKLRPYDVYGQGWAMTHFLTFSKTRSQQLRQYLAALTAGKSPGEAAMAFGNLAQLNREAHAYLMKGSFEYKPVQVPIRQPVVQRVTAVSAGESALIPETIAFNDDDLNAYRKESDRNQERNRRTRVLDQIRRKAARNASDPYALYLLAEAENAAGNASASEAATDRLLAIDPDNVRGLVRKSLLLSDSASRLNGSARLQRAAEARQLAMRANKADPDQTLTYVAFYQGFRATGAKVPANAVEGLDAAVQKLPANTSVRQMLVDEYAAEKRWAAAIQILAPMANSSHDSPLRQAAREKMARLQAELAKASGKAQAAN